MSHRSNPDAIHGLRTLYAKAKCDVKMTEKQEVVEETTQEEATEEQENTQDESQEDTQETTEATEEHSQIDYEKIAKEEQERAAEATRKLEETRQKARERFQKKQETEVDEDIDDEDKPLTRKELQQFFQEQQQQTLRSVQRVEAKTIAKTIANTDAEVNALLAIMDNRVVPSGNVEEDVYSAWGILNARANTGKISELKRAIASKNLSAHNTATTHRDGASPAEPKMSANDRQAYVGAGLKWDPKTKHFTKSIAGGKKTLHKDPKSGKTWVTTKS